MENRAMYHPYSNSSFDRSLTKDVLDVVRIKSHDDNEVGTYFNTLHFDIYGRIASSIYRENVAFLRVVADI
jgi:hypothetical protein